MLKLAVLKKWVKMLSGNSIFHVEQSLGKCYSKNEVKGYYNDLTKKVSNATILDENGIPINTTVSGKNVYFPITIFQYGLGLYDLYLLTENKEYHEKFMVIANWAYENQEKNGMWECMKNLGDTKHSSQSSMCQSEGVSVLLRAYVSTKNEKYYEAATKSINFMIKSVDDGGTCFYETDNNPIFQEYVSKYNLSVLNGWIFSIFGLYDYTLINKEKKYKKILNDSITTMCKHLKKYDRKFWSNYDQKGTIASPAYNDLHVQQLRLLNKLFQKDEFEYYANKWDNYQKSKFKRILAMLIKLKQKLLKSKYYDINTNLVK